MAHIRLGKREDGRNPLIKDFAPLASLDDIVFGGWDPISANALEAARTCGVLEEKDLAPISAEMEGIVAMEAVFDQKWVSRLDGTRVKTETNMWDQAMALMADIENFRTENDCDRLVMVWCGSTEAFQEASDVHAHDRGVRGRAQGQRRQHLAEPDLRLRRAPVRRAVRQRRPEPLDRPPLHDRARRSATACRSPARTSRPARPS